MIILIDNYDSFSYNLYQYIGSINPDIKVIRNDELTIDEIKALNPTHIIISPGPGKPKDSGIIEDVIRYIDKPILGVCLGHQAICEVFGSNIIHAPVIMHGKKDIIDVDNTKTVTITYMKEDLRIVKELVGECEGTVNEVSQIVC